jgi:hypothetical protein
MNHAGQRLSEARRQHNEAVVTRHLHPLFQRLPMLSGFWLRPDLKVAEVIFIWTGYPAWRDLYDQVTESLVRLAEECPGTVQLMRGHTFARAVH